MTEQQYIKLRSEAKAPFRFTRMYIFGALAGGAGIGLLIITTRLIAALQGAASLVQRGVSAVSCLHSSLVCSCSQSIAACDAASARGAERLDRRLLAW
jgi:hypothetical protein